MSSGFLCTYRAMRVSSWQRSSSASSSRSLMEKLPRARRAASRIRSKPGVLGSIGRRGRVVAIWWGNRLPVETLQAKFRKRRSHSPPHEGETRAKGSLTDTFEATTALPIKISPAFSVICDNPRGNGHDPPKTHVDDKRVRYPVKIRDAGQPLDQS